MIFRIAYLKNLAIMIKKQKNPRGKGITVAIQPVLSKEKRKELDYLILNESSVSHKTEVGKQFMSMSVLGLGFLLYIHDDLNFDIDKRILAVSAFFFLLAICKITWFFNKVSKDFALRIRIIVENNLTKKELLKVDATKSNRVLDIIAFFYKIEVFFAILLCLILAWRIIFLD